MRIGIPKEVKSNEFRVSVTPSGVAELVHRNYLEHAVSYPVMEHAASRDL